ncbi:hypothetical protein VDGD_20941 [Verticillium dahliae]|uniref:Uncharacterized protein n=1 Tax=Verticillium dahliae TaxID=27337 RepID=A0AA45APB4_VERDA|nr:hypothetical protein BJF96_g1640 [Verticillium dahliae]RBQ83621.1 hypothetical protein VDGD_20941 [Verticillium dahliae]
MSNDDAAGEVTESLKTIGAGVLSANDAFFCL